MPPRRPESCLSGIHDNAAVHTISATIIERSYPSERWPTTVGPDGVIYKIAI